MQQKNKPQICILHNQQFNFYCENCEEPVCHLCTTLGPHNFKLHRCNKLQDAFAQRVYRIQEEVKQNLLPKREQLLAQIYRIEYRIEEIRYVTSIIERDARAEMGGVLERLRREQGAKSALLQHEAQEIQKDINEMNDLGKEFIKLTDSNEQDQIDFLLNCENLFEKIEFLIAKPIKNGIDVNVNDLPKELTDLRMEIGKVEAQKKSLELLNDIIFQLLKERKQQEETLQAVLQNGARNELSEWVKLVDHFTEQLKQQQLVCFFCNQRIDSQIINKKCKQNTNVPQEKVQGFTKERPTDQNMGNLRHFWGHSKEESILKDMLRPENKKIPNFVLIEPIISKIKKRSQDKQIDLRAVLSAHDKNSNGEINHINFSFVLTDITDITTEEIEMLIFFLDDEQKGNIVIEEFLIYLRSNQRVHERSNYLANTYKPKKTLKGKYFQTPNTD